MARFSSSGSFTVFSFFVAMYGASRQFIWSGMGTPLFRCQHASATSLVSQPFHPKTISTNSMLHRKQASSTFGTNNLFAIRGGSSLSSSDTTSEDIAIKEEVAPKKIILRQVQLVHRHGDRTPITPMANETFWKDTLPNTNILQNIALGTYIKREEGSARAVHAAGGKGFFGQLTTLGLFQMVDLGSKIREELLKEVPISIEGDKEVKENNKDESAISTPIEIIKQMGCMYQIISNHLFTPEVPLTTETISVCSTDFPRTIQSVQGFLIGLFPDGIPSQSTTYKENDPIHDRIENIIKIDARYTSTMIPDPQPRRSKEQVELEKKLSNRLYILKKEDEMKDFGIRLTQILLKENILGDGYQDVTFGVGEEKEENEMEEFTSTTVTRPLPWSQLSEILKCLAIRELLPSSISTDDQHLVTSHAAWKWFENLRHPRLAYLSMQPMMKRMVENIEEEINSDGNIRLHIFSAHDSTLIGLLSAFRLEQPSEWPEYGSYLKLELYEVLDDDKTDSMEEDEQSLNEERFCKYMVRFSLNSRTLRCFWDVKEGADPLELLPFDRLIDLLQADGIDKVEDNGGTIA